MKITARINIIDANEVANFLTAKTKAEIDNSILYTKQDFCHYAINKYCKQLLEESGIDE